MANRKIWEYGVKINTDTASLNTLKQELQGLKNLTGQDLINIGSVQNLNEANEKLKDIKNSVTQVQAALNKSFNTSLGTTDLSKLNTELGKLKLDKIAQEFKTAGAAGQNAFRTLTTDVLTTNLQLKESHAWLKEMGQTMGNTIKWSISSSVMNSFTGSLQKAYSYIKGLDTSLNNIRIVTGKSAEDMDRFAISANRAAKELAATTRDYTEASLIYFQQGLGDADVAARAETTLKAANVTGQSTAAVSEQLTAVWNGYKVSAQEAEAYIDKLAAVAATTASDLEELSTGMSKVSSAANLMGVDIDQLNAQLATIVSVTRQAPESVGTALKTIYARMGDIESGIDTETTLGKYTSQMAEMGVNVLDINGNLRDMGEVIEEIGNKWTLLSREQQIALSQTMAGTRQYNNLLSLFDNWDMYTEAINTSRNSVGELQKQQDIYMESTAAHLEQLSTSMERIYSDLIDSKALNSIVDVFVKAAEGVANYIEAIGGAGGAFSQLGAIAMKVFGNQIAKSLTTTISNLGIAKSNAQQLSAQIQVLEKFKGIKIDDENYQRLVTYKQAFIDLNNTLTEEQRQYADSLLEQRNQLANQKAAWDEAALAAQEYYNKAANNYGENEKLDIFDTSYLGNVDELSTKIDTYINDFSQKSKQVIADAKDIVETADASFLEVYFEQTHTALNSGLRIDEKTKTDLKKSMNDINIIMKIDKNVLADEQIEKVNQFRDAYIKMSNQIRAEAEKTKTIIEQSASGMADTYATAVDTIDSQIEDFIKKMQMQQIIQGFTEVSSQIFMINSAISSVRRLPNIWNDENISTGEKVLQTIMAVTNGINVLVQGYRLVNTVAETMRKIQTLNTLSTAASTKAIEENKNEMQNNANVQDKGLQKQSKETAQNMAQETLSIIDNTAALNENSRAILNNKKAKESKIGNNKDLREELNQSDKKSGKLGISILQGSNTDFAKRSIEKIGTAYKEIKDLNPDTFFGKLVKSQNEASKSSHSLWENLSYLLAGNKKGTGKMGGLLGLITAHPLITASIVGIGVGFIYLKNKIEEPQKEIDNLRESSKRLAEEANNTKTAIQDLASSWENFKTAKDTFDMCIEGTQDWQEALYKVNETIIEILNKYPKLAQMQNFLQFDQSTGLLTPNEEILKQYQQDLQKRYIIQTAASQTANVIANQKDYENRINKLRNFGANTNAKNEWFTKEKIEELGIIANSEVEYNKEIEQLVDKYIADENRSTDPTLRNNIIKKLQSNREEIANLYNLKSNYSAQENNALNLISSTVLSSPDATNVQRQIVGQLYKQNYEKELNNLDKELDKKLHKWAGTKNEGYQTLLKEYNAAMGTNYKAATSNPIRGWNGEEGIYFYDPIKKEDVKFDRDNLQQTIASNRALNPNIINPSANYTKDIFESIRNSTGFSDDLIDRVLTQGFSATESLDLNEYNQIIENKDKIIEAIVKDDNFKKLGYKSAEDFINALNQGLEDFDEEKAKEFIQQRFDSTIKTNTTRDAKKYDLNQEELEIYAKHLANIADESKELSDDLDENGKAATVLAKSIARMNKGVETLAENWKDWNDILKKSSPESEEYALALYKTQDAMMDLLDVGEEARKYFTDDLIKKHSKEITQAAKGDAKAIDNLKNIFRDQAILQIGIDNKLDDNAKSNLNSLISNLMNEIPNMKIGIDTELDPEKYANFIQTCQDIVDTAGLTKDQANALFGLMGFEAKYQTDEQPTEYQVPVYTTYTRKTGEEEFNGNKYDTVETWTEQTDVKKLTGKYATFGMAVTPEGESAKSPKITGMTKKASGIFNNYSSKNAGGGSPGKKSGGGSKPKKEDKIKDEKDRYHTVNTQLQLISNDLEKLNDQREKLFGKDLVDNLVSEFNLLDKEIATTTEKIAIANEESRELRDSLSKQGVTFGADGTISNYAAAYDAQLAAVNAIVNKYNSMTSEQQEAYQDTLDDAKEKWNEFKEDMDRYDELQSSFIPDLEKKIREDRDKQIENSVKRFDLEIELRLDMAEATKQWNDWKKKIIDGIEEDDILGNAQARLIDYDIYFQADGKGIAQKLTDQVNATLDELKKQDIKADSIYGDNRTLALEDLKKYYEELMTALEDVWQIQEDIHQAYLDMMDEAQEKFDEQIDAYETVSDMIEHDMELIQLVRGEEAYGNLAEYYDKQQANNAAQLDFLRQQENFWAQAMREAEEGSDQWIKAKENWIAAVEATNDKINNSIQIAQDKYLNMIELTFQELNKKVTGGTGLNYVSEEWTLLKKNADMYLDTVNGIYNVQQLANKYQTAIDDTDSVSAQTKLKNLMEEELAILQEKDKLTQYDIDRAELRYQIALKQIALEEAQQNKSTMRLRRDSQGNYSYQFVADEDQTQGIQDEISNLYNQLYNLDYDKYQDNLDQVYDLWAETQEKMKEAAQINDPEERARMELLYREQYGEMINNLVAQNEEIRVNLQESTWMELMDFYKNDEEAFKNNLGEKFAGVEEILDATQISTNQWLEDTANAFQMVIDQITGEDEGFMTQLITGWDNGIQQMINIISGDGGFEQTCKDAWQSISDATNQYNKDLEELEVNSGRVFDNIVAGQDKNLEKAEDLVQENNDLIDTYETMFDAMDDVVDKLAAITKGYEDAARAAKEAAIAAREYQVAATGKAADEYSKDKGTATSSKNDTTLQTQPSTNTSTSGNAGSGSGNGTSEDSGDGTARVGDVVTFVSGSYFNDSYGGGPTGSRGRGKQAKITAMNSKGVYPIHLEPYNNNNGAFGWVKLNQISGYDTGGYTGAWGSEGRLALLHQKELVLNAQDTKNMLNAVEVLRNITANLGSSIMDKLSGISANNIMAYANGAGNAIEQYVQIDASFPNVRDAKEVENAINNLMNRAYQHVNKR